MSTPTYRRIISAPQQFPKTSRIFLLPAKSVGASAHSYIDGPSVNARPTGVILKPVKQSLALRTSLPVAREKRHAPPAPINLKRTSCLPIEDILNETCNQPTIPRKRERLNHLTPEEKLNRRKLKNRMAAQTARDRKKERTQRLEDAVRRLFEDNKKLRSENANLKARLDRLEALQAQQSSRLVAPTFESAAFINVPLPREQVSTSIQGQSLGMRGLLILMTYLFSISRNLQQSSPISKNDVLQESSTHEQASPSSSQDWGETPNQEFDEIDVGSHQLSPSFDYSSPSNCDQMPFSPSSPYCSAVPDESDAFFHHLSDDVSDAKDKVIELSFNFEQDAPLELVPPSFGLDGLDTPYYEQQIDLWESFSV